MDEQPQTRSRAGRYLGFFIVLIVLVPIWFFFIGPELRHRRIVNNGVQVEGRLLSVDETGTTVNDAPELELTVAFTRKDGVLDTSSTDFVPTLRTIHLYQPGTLVKIAYLEDDPDEITMVAISNDAPTGATTRTPSAEAGGSSQPTATQRKLDSLQRLYDSVVEASKPK